MSKNQTPSPDIGKEGMVGGNRSTEGGQLPFMPSPSSYSGRNEPKGVKPGKSDSTTRTPYPFLPSKPE